MRIIMVSYVGFMEQEASCGLVLDTSVHIFIMNLMIHSYEYLLLNHLSSLFLLF